MNVDLTKLNLQQAAALADTLLRTGAFAQAEQVYRAIDATAPGNSHVMARIGLAKSPHRYSREMLGVLELIENFNPNRAFVSSGLATWLKTLPFAEDARFMEIADRHAHLLPLANWHWNLQTVVWAARQAGRLDGDFVELGVFRGHTTLFVAEYLEFQKASRRWWLYDTFDGIPDDQVDPGWEKNNKAAYRGTFSYEEVRERFSPFPNIDVIQGRVPEILHQRCPERIAFLHMDLNNTKAEIQALDALFDRIVPGGVIVFDDYGWAVAKAQFDAENAWFAERGLFILPIPTGQGLFIKQ